jgi:plastocyanin
MSSSRRTLVPLIAAPLLLVGAIGATAGQEAEDVEPADASAITIAGFAFEEQRIEVAAGTTVTWTNQDAAPHSIVDFSEQFATSPDLAQGDTFEATYDSPGEYDYICGIHEYMRGTVTVT